MPQENQLFSVGVFVIVERDESILFVKSRKHMRYSLPGGGVDPIGAGTEVVTEAGIREVWEEARHEVRLGRLIGVFSLQKSHGIVLVFKGISERELPFDESDEIVERRWIPITAFGEPEGSTDGIDIFPAQRGIIEQYLKYRNTPGHFPIFGPPVPIHETANVRT